MDVKFDFEARRRRLVDQLQETATQNPGAGDSTALLVSNRVNVRYLSGFTGSNGLLLFDTSGCTLLTDGRYTSQAASQCPDLPARIRPLDVSMTNFVVETVNDSAAETIFIESEHVTRQFHLGLSGGIADKSLLDSSQLVETLRSIKDDKEIELIRKSVQINENAIEATLGSFDSAWTEQQFAWQLEREIRSLGGSGFSFDAIVGAGPASALPHYHPADVKIADQGFALVDWGTSYSGYASDLTRMLAIGKVPDKIREIHKVVSDAKGAAIAAVKNGAQLRDVDHAARSLIAAAGFGDEFGHGLGHSFGLEIHESPFMSPAFDGQLVTGMVITIEPGIYLAGVGGVRLEDDVLVTDTGCEVLNRLPDDFLQVA